MSFVCRRKFSFASLAAMACWWAFDAIGAAPPCAVAPSVTKETRNENLKLNPEDNDLDEAVQQVLEVEVVPDGLVVALDRVRILRARLPIAPVVPQQEAGQQRVAADHR